MLKLYMFLHWENVFRLERIINENFSTFFGIAYSSSFSSNLRSNTYLRRLHIIILLNIRVWRFSFLLSFKWISLYDMKDVDLLQKHDFELFREKLKGQLNVMRLSFLVCIFWGYVVTFIAVASDVSFISVTLKNWQKGKCYRNSKWLLKSCRK